MKLRVELKEGQIPRTYDAETGEDLTYLVREIQIKTSWDTDAILYEKKEDGSYPFIDVDTLKVAIVRIPIERIEGTWVAKERQPFPPCGQGMDNFRLSEAREALIRLQNFPNPKGWSNEEIEQLNKAMEALFPDGEGDALHKRMTEEIKQKKA